MASNHLLRPLIPLFVAAITAAVAVVAAAQTAPRELLNSERIAATFGNYGVTVLEQNAVVRVSSLFSEADEQRTCRTFAIVLYAERIDPSLSAEHAKIVAGGSIGAVFAASGWEVRKTHLYYGERAASAKLASLMHIAAGTPLAEHVYVLDVVKDGRAIEYAALVEIHHPAYLSLANLAAIYGVPDAGDRRQLLATMLATATERVR